MRSALGTLLGILLAAPAADAASLRSADAVADLSGPWLFHRGDNPAFASPTFDDRDWTLKRLPTSGTAFDERWIEHQWYRYHLTVAPAATHVELLLVIGSTHGAMEAYVNGEPVARRGRFGLSPVGGADVLPLAGIVRPGLLSAGDNLVALRVYDTSYNGGLPNGPIVLGVEELTLPAVKLRGQAALGARIGLTILALCLALAQLLVVFGRRASRENWWLFGGGIAVAIFHLGGTGVLSWLVPGMQLAYRIPLVAGLVSVLCLGSYFAARYDDWGARHVLIGRYVLIGLAAVLFIVWESVVFLAGHGILLLAGLVAALYSANQLAKAARRQEAGTMPIFASLVLLVLLFVYDGIMTAASSAMPPLSAIGAVGVLLVTSLTMARGAMAEHERVLSEMLRLRRVVEGRLLIGILDATAMSITQPDDFLDAVVHEGARQLEVRRCSLVLVSDDGRLVVRAAVGLPAYAAGQEVTREGTIAGWVCENGHAVSSASLPEELAAKRSGRGYLSEGFVCHPVQHGTRILGALNVAERADGSDFSPSDEIEVGEVADKLALVLTRLGRTAGAWQVEPRAEQTAPASVPVIMQAESKARRIDLPQGEAAATSDDQPDSSGEQWVVWGEGAPAQAADLAAPGAPEVASGDAGSQSAELARPLPPVSTRRLTKEEFEAEVESAIDFAVAGIEEPPDDDT